MPRTAAELRAAAIATGWFDGPHLAYVGDGYTIPWQTGLYIGPVFGGTLHAWKDYLDANFKEPSRLHDWLYCPYGPDLIGATQEEADLALREEMVGAGVDVIQAELVYQACHLGGSPWYGVSTVGYIPPAPEGSGDNITPAFAGIGVAMANFKVMMVFQNTSAGSATHPSLGYVTTPRTGSWTESYYDVSSSIDAVLRTAKGPRTDGVLPVLQARAALLPITARILGLRIYEGGGGRGQFYPVGYPGTYPLADVPSMALLCATTSPSSPTVRRFTMRGIPDNQVTAGEFAPNSTFVTELKAYFDSLLNTAFLGSTLVPIQDIFTINAAGLLTAMEAITYTGGQIITISQSLDDQGRRRSGRYRVQSTGPTASQLTLADWTWGDTTGGKVSIPIKAFFPVLVGRTSAVRITNHKVGRPFAGYVGRNSPRKR